MLDTDARAALLLLLLLLVEGRGSWMHDARTLALAAQSLDHLLAHSRRRSRCQQERVQMRMPRYERDQINLRRQQCQQKTGERAWEDPLHYQSAGQARRRRTSEHLHEERGTAAAAGPAKHTASENTTSKSARHTSRAAHLGSCSGRSTSLRACVNIWSTNSKSADVAPPICGLTQSHLQTAGENPLALTTTTKTKTTTKTTAPTTAAMEAIVCAPAPARCIR